MTAKALIVVDMQNDFLDPKGVLYCGAAARLVIPKVVSLVDRFLRDDLPVVFTQDTHVENDKEFAAFARHCVKGEWGHKLIPELEILSQNSEATVIQKARYNGFFHTNMEEYLGRLKPERVEVCGVCTSICVMDTVGELRNRDYAVRVCKAAVADFDPQMHEFALQRMVKIYAAEVQ